MRTFDVIKSILIVVLLCGILVAGGVGFYYIYKQASDSKKSSIPQEKETVCGDGICQRVTCDGIGCPFPENYLTCPIDCE